MVHIMREKNLETVMKEKEEGQNGVECKFNTSAMVRDDVIWQCTPKQKAEDLCG